ncbi:hypothetical protein D3C81_2128470 [compost metagenome]
MVAAGRIDDGVRRLRLLDDELAVVQIAVYAQHADGGQLGHLLRFAHEPRHLMAGPHEA